MENIAPNCYKLLAKNKDLRQFGVIVYLGWVGVDRG